MSKLRRKIKKTMREQLITPDSRCSNCGTQEELTLDHIRPLALGGAKNHPRNLQVLCLNCNNAKDDYWDGESGFPAPEVTDSESIREAKRAAADRIKRERDLASGQFLQNRIRGL